MRDNLNEIETRSAVQNSISEEDLVTRLYEQRESEQSYFVIDKFPKEFKKNLFGSVDLRFFIILFFSFIFHFTTILLLEKKIPDQIDAKTITKIQKQYIELLVDDDMSLASLYELEQRIEPLDYETITGLTNWMDGIAENALESIKDMPVFIPEAPSSIPAEVAAQETKVPTKETMSGIRDIVAKARIQSRAELEQKVGSIGLLGLIGSKGQEVDQEYIDDLLEYADLNEDHLESVLSKLSSIQVPHHNTAGYILNYKQDADISGGKLRGTKRNTRKEIQKIIKNMEPLQSAKTTKVERKTTYEEIPSSNPLSRLRSKNLAGKKRTAKDVIRVVQSHKRALQDCYKQELKVNPTVKGKIIVRFTVDPNGNVVKVSVVSSTLKSSRMENCLVRRIKNWRDFGYCDPSIGNVTYKQVFNFGGD